MITILGGNVNAFMAERPERAEKDWDGKPRPKPGLDRKAVSTYNNSRRRGKRLVRLDYYSFKGETVTLPGGGFRFLP